MVSWNDSGTKHVSLAIGCPRRLSAAVGDNAFTWENGDETARIFGCFGRAGWRIGRKRTGGGFPRGFWRRRLPWRFWRRLPGGWRGRLPGIGGWRLAGGTFCGRPRGGGGMKSGVGVGGRGGGVGRKGLGLGWRWGGGLGLGRGLGRLVAGLRYRDRPWTCLNLSMVGLRLSLL